MSAESDVQLQQFADAVYSQNDSENGAGSKSPLGEIESRSIKFALWRDAAAIESDETPEIPERLLRHWVDGDIASFRLLSASDEEVAADNISLNFQNHAAYRAEMELLADDVAKKVDDLKKESLRRGIEQDRVSAKDLVARLRDTEAQANLPKDASGLNGFAGTENRDERAPETPTASKVLDRITYQTRPDGSVLYLVDERPAFIDHGRHIIIDDKALEDEESILGAILLAKEKYGGAFSLTGTDAFKRKALEVILKNNVEIRLKSPAQEILLREIAASSFPNYKLPLAIGKSVQADGVGAPVPREAASTVEPAISGDQHTRPSSSLEPDILPSINRLAGKLLDHGIAPYGNDPSNRNSYFVTVENKDGVNTTTWGVGLSEAIKKCEVATGTEIELVNNGRQPVTVEKNVKDEQGNVIGQETIETHRNEWIVIAGSQETSKEPVPISLSNDVGEPRSQIGNPQEEQLQAELTRISAADWWLLQKNIISQWGILPKERDELLSGLGDKPDINKMYWFDKSGNQIDTPKNAAPFITALNENRYDVIAENAVSSGDLDLITSLDLNEMYKLDSVLHDLELSATSSEVSLGEKPKISPNLIRSFLSGRIEHVLEQKHHSLKLENDMSEQDDTKSVDADNKPILRGVVATSEGFDTTVLLFKGKGDYLQGFVKVGDVKHQVIAHLNERDPDHVTGEIKPNFIKLSKAVGAGDDTKWTEMGFGNALNKRKDEKPVYFDEVLLNIEGKVLNARVTKHVDESMHRKLGFVEAQIPRPEKVKSLDAESVTDAKPAAAAAKLVGESAPPQDQPTVARAAPKKRSGTRA
ncbi:LPD7 domain-containing protein [Pseudomonas sp. AB12(2023)]|uniref:LPD7 domain-containing protein n=1 Tax=Pseudomonas sp. AB12(2023) TaxID=3048597 RepID=UPI002B221A5B|nr:LPD7 domain-containing protein [Pseudomonas sp. AB12(2023)]MEB0221348.1 hypothetical protein [Pseudomonas sp. AB12(2023)]